MRRFWVVLLVSIWGAAICQAAPQDTPAAAPAEGGSGEGGDSNAAADLTEVTELMAWLKMNVKYVIGLR